MYFSFYVTTVLLIYNKARDLIIFVKLYQVAPIENSYGVIFSLE